MAKTTINRAELLNAVSQAFVAVPSRTPKDILRNVLIVRKNDDMEVIATDMELGIRASLSAANNDRGTMEVLLNAQRLKTILSEMTDDTITMTVTMTKVTISGAHSKFNLSTESLDEFPPVPGFSKSAAIALNAHALKTALARTIFASDNESTRYALGGVLFEASAESLKVVATDSRRLAVAEIGGCDRSAETIPTQVIVPSKAVRAIAAAAEKAESAKFYADQNTITLQIGNVIVYSRLLEGRFPKYQAVIPPRSNIVVPLPVGPFLSAVRQATVMSDKESVAVVFRFEQGTLYLHSESSVGESLIELTCEYNRDEKFEIKFDPKYIVDMFRLLPSDRIVELNLVDNDTAAVFKYDMSYTYVVMPLTNDR